MDLAKEVEAVLINDTAPVCEKAFVLACEKIKSRYRGTKVPDVMPRDTH